MAGIKFIDRNLKRLKSESRVEYSDTSAGSVRILKLLATPAGSRTWYARYSSPVEHNNKGRAVQRRIKLGSYPAVSINVARKLATEIQATVDLGKDPAMMTADGEVDTVRSLFEKYVDASLAIKRASYRDETIRLFKARILPAIGKVRIDKLTDRMVVKIWENAEADGRKRKPDDPRAGRGMAALTYRTLSAFFKFSVERGWISENPIRDRRYKSNAKPRTRYLTLVELRRYWHGLYKANIDHKTRDLLQVLLLTGQRTQELTKAKISDFDFDKALWTIPEELSKNHNEHTLPLPDMAVEILRTAVDRYEYNRFNSGLIFPAKPRSKLQAGVDAVPTNRNVTSHAVRRNLEVMGFKDKPFHPHDFRRTLATTLADDGTAPHIIEAILNHKSGVVSGVAAIYNRARMVNQMREAMNRWGQIVEEAIGSPPEPRDDQ